MQWSTKKREFDQSSGFKNCELPDGEYLFVVKSIKDPHTAMSGKTWVFIETTAIGAGDQLLPKEEKGPDLMIKWDASQMIPFPDWMGEGIWQKFNEVTGMAEAETVASEDYINAPFIAVVETRTFKEQERKQFKSGSLTTATKEHVALVVEHLGKQS